MLRMELEIALQLPPASEWDTAGLVEVRVRFSVVITVP